MGNDVVADNAGNAYLTNSYGDFIWKVRMEGIATVFAKNSIFLSQLVVVNSSVAWWGLNGLVYHTEGTYLLVVQSYSGAMFKGDLESAKVEVVNLKNPLTSRRRISSCVTTKIMVGNGEQEQLGVCCGD
jgi:hypothetical protein